VFVAARKHAADDSNPFTVERYGGIQSHDNDDSVMYMLFGSFLSYCHMPLFSNHLSVPTSGLMKRLRDDYTRQL
jgi:hypothetical protein